MGKGCGVSFPFSVSVFSGLFDHSITAWGIRTTNLIFQTIDFRRTYRYCVLLLRLPVHPPNPKLGLPWQLRGERNCLQCRRPGFSPWVRKIPLKEEMCILRKQRGQSSECSCLVVKILDEPPRWQLTVNDVGFVISKEDLASGSGTRLDHSELLCGRSFITAKKDRERF